VITPGEPPNPELGTHPFELLGIGGSPWNISKSQ
jgi:hypothetical protein